MSILNNLSLITQLNTFAHGLVNDPVLSIANIVAPIVNVPTITGFYKSFGDKEAFAIYITKRAPGGPARRMSLSATDTQYSCTSNGLELLIADEVAVKSINGGAELPFYNQQVAALLSATYTSNEKFVFDFIKANITATAGKGLWAGAAQSGSISPMYELQGEINAIQDATGQPVDVVAFGNAAWAAFVGHSKTQGLFPGSVMITPDVVRQSLQAYGVRQVVVGNLGWGVNVAQPRTGSNIVGSEVYILQAKQSATQFDNSAFKQFVYSENLGQVKTYREESLSSDVLKVEWCSDIKLTNAYGAKRITVTGT